MAYSDLIREATGCGADEAPCVEQLMRDSNDGVLSELRPARFRSEAKKALGTVRAFQEARSDPDRYAAEMGMGRDEFDDLLRRILEEPVLLAG